MHKVFIEYSIPLNNVLIIGDQNFPVKIFPIRHNDTQLKEDKEIIVKIRSIMLK